MADLFRETKALQQPQPGDIRWGVLLSIAEKGATVDVDAFEGSVSPADLAKIPRGERESLQEGQEVLVYVVGGEDATGKYHLSLNLARKEQDWLEAEELLRQKGYWEGRISGYNKGGLVVPFGHIRGFVPASQITGFPRTLRGEDKLSRLAQYVGQELAFQVIEVDRRQRRLVLSERLGRSARQAARQQQVFDHLHKGAICRGRVRAMTEYGAFVDVGGAVGLVHRTEMAWFRVEHPCEIVHEGQEVDVVVLRVSRDRGRISFSLKRTYPDPWPGVTERYQLGQVVEGRVIRRTGAGLSLMADDGILGFVSEGDLRQSGRPDEEFALGQRIVTKLVRIDGARRRLGLSVRRVRDAEWAQWQQRLEAQDESDSDIASPAPLSEE